MNGKRPYTDLFLVSFLLLFFELACIRWFGSTVVFLTFFTNIVLLATFLGMSVGCLAASSERDWSRAVMPLFLTAAAMAYLSLLAYNHYGRVMVDVGGQGSPQQVYFGTEYRARDVASFVIPIEVLAAAFFVLIALVFVGIGQVMGRAFNEAGDRLTAYISNIAGSLAGIAAFALASYVRTTPMTWFAIVALIWAVLSEAAHHHTDRRADPDGGVHGRLRVYDLGLGALRAVPHAAGADVVAVLQDSVQPGARAD